MPHSTHKRKRSASRADRARSVPGGGGRLISTVYADTERGRRERTAAVEAHPFNHQLDLVLPVADPSDVAAYTALCTQLTSLAAADGNEAYMARVPLTLFLSPRFVATYIQSGALYAFSAGRLDADDTVCLDGQGMLVLSLRKDTYQTLGLVGRPSRFARGASGRMGDRTSGPVERYSTYDMLMTVVELPLLAPSFQPGKRGYERALYCFKAWDAARAAPETHDTATWPMFFVWTPPAKPEACPDDVMHAPVVFPASVPEDSVRRIALDVHTETYPDRWLPCLAQQPDADDSLADTLLPHQASEAWESARDQLLAFAGLASADSARLQTFDRCPPHVAQYVPMEPSMPGTLVHVRVQGMFAPSFASTVLHTVETWLRSRPESPNVGNWACITLTGFPDTPLAWCSRYPGLGLALGSGLSVHDTDVRVQPVASKARRKGTLRRGESEHGIVRTGENGWTALLLPASPRSGTLFVESLELDTRN